MAKKKTNPQSKNNKSPETQLAIPRQTIDEGSSEKLYYLKTLNAMLLEETVERRQQVRTLTRVNRSLGSELNRCESQLNELIERVVMLEFENELVSGFFAVLGKEMSEISGKERVAMEEKFRELERDASRVLDETNAIEKAKNKKVADLRTEIDVLVKEKQEMEGDLRRLTEEKNLVSKDLQEALKKTEHQKLIIDEIVLEKTRINYAKNQGEGYIVQLNGEIDDLKNTIRTLESSRFSQDYKIMQLESNLSDLRAAVDRAKTERNKTQSKLEKEKLNSREKISKMKNDFELRLQRKMSMATRCMATLEKKKERVGKHLCMVKIHC